MSWRSCQQAAIFQERRQLSLKVNVIKTNIGESVMKLRVAELLELVTETVGSGLLLVTGLEGSPLKESQRGPNEITPPSQYNATPTPKYKRKHLHPLLRTYILS